MHGNSRDNLIFLSVELEDNVDRHFYVMGSQEFKKKNMTKTFSKTSPAVTHGFLCTIKDELII